LQWKPISKSCLSTDANYVIPGPFVLSPFLSLRKSMMRSPFPSSRNLIASFLTFGTTLEFAPKNCPLCNIITARHRAPHSFVHCSSTAYLKIRVSHFSFWRNFLYSHPLHLCSSKSAHHQICGVSAGDNNQGRSQSNYRFGCQRTVSTRSDLVTPGCGFSIGCMSTARSR
jgi:hypothetical protein